MIVWWYTDKYRLRDHALCILEIQLSRPMGKPTICIGENKGADQLRSNCEADQRLCFRYTDSTIPLLPKYKIPCFYQSSVTVQAGLCQTCSKTTLLVFPRDGSIDLDTTVHVKEPGSGCSVPKLLKNVDLDGKNRAKLHL